jgi:hypothetical protein
MMRGFKKIFNDLLLNNPDTVLIHIGKCGGSSLRTAIRNLPIENHIKIVHIDKPNYRKKRNYYIVARDPVSRCVSAFNWRYKLGVSDQSQKTRFAGEYDILNKYTNLNSLAESLYDSNGDRNSVASADFEAIHHLRERIAFYLKEFLTLCPQRQINGVLMKESLAEDIKRHFGVSSENVGIEKKFDAGPDNNYLSPRGRNNLVRYIEDDYYCLFKLYNYGLIRKDIITHIYERAIL